jgi:MFS family permease
LWTKKTQFVDEYSITFNLYRVLGGIGVGMALAIVPMYIAEIAPSQVRGTLVSCNLKPTEVVLLKQY